MNQQRSRRYRAAYAREAAIHALAAEGDAVLDTSDSSSDEEDMRTASGAVGAAAAAGADVVEPDNEPVDDDAIDDADAKVAGIDNGEEDTFDPNCITPGTAFMTELTAGLVHFTQRMVDSHPLWQGLKVIVSGADVPGEGEHKILEFLRCKKAASMLAGSAPAKPLKHCIYGLDADLVLLGLATHEPHVVLLREATGRRPGRTLGSTALTVWALAEKPRTGGGPPLSKAAAGKAAFWGQEETGGCLPRGLRPRGAVSYEYLWISMLREYLDVEFRAALTEHSVSTVSGEASIAPRESGDVPWEATYDLERCIDDFVLLVTLVGNDFLPALPGFRIDNGDLDSILATYKTLLASTGHISATHLISDTCERAPGEEGFVGGIHFGRLEVLLRELIGVEKIALRTMLDLMAEFHDAEGLLPQADAEDATGFGGFHSDDSEADDVGESDDDAWFADPPDGAAAVAAASDGAVVGGSPVTAGSGTAEAELVEIPEYKVDYYHSKFEGLDARDPTGAAKIRTIVADYCAGLRFVLAYYYAGVPSWTFYYPHHFAPLVSDLCTQSEGGGLRETLGEFVVAESAAHAAFEPGEPFLPLHQLLAVLPPASAHLVPQAYRRLMMREGPASDGGAEDSLAEFFPSIEDVRLDDEDAKADWEAVLCLPFVDASRLVTVANGVEEALTEPERARNQHGVASLIRSMRPERDESAGDPRESGVGIAQEALLIASSEPRGAALPPPPVLASLFGTVEDCVASVDVGPVDSLAEMLSDLPRGAISAAGGPRQFNPSCAAGATPVGWPSLRSAAGQLPSLYAMQRVGSDVLGGSSRGDSAVLRIPQGVCGANGCRWMLESEVREGSTLLTVAEGLLGRVVNVLFPHSRNAIVTSVSSAAGVVRLPSAPLAVAQSAIPVSHLSVLPDGSLSLTPDLVVPKEFPVQFRKHAKAKSVKKAREWAARQARRDGGATTPGSDDGGAAPDRTSDTGAERSATQRPANEAVVDPHDKTKRKRWRTVAEAVSTATLKSCAIALCPEDREADEGVEDTVEGAAGGAVAPNGRQSVSKRQRAKQHLQACEVSVMVQATLITGEWRNSDGSLLWQTGRDVLVPVECCSMPVHTGHPVHDAVPFSFRRVASNIKLGAAPEDGLGDRALVLVQPSSPADAKLGALGGTCESGKPATLRRCQPCPRPLRVRIAEAACPTFLSAKATAAAAGVSEPVLLRVSDSLSVGGLRGGSVVVGLRLFARKGNFHRPGWSLSCGHDSVVFCDRVPALVAAYKAAFPALFVAIEARTSLALHCDQITPLLGDDDPSAASEVDRDRTRVAALVEAARQWRTSQGIGLNAPLMPPTSRRLPCATESITIVGEEPVTSATEAMTSQASAETLRVPTWSGQKRIVTTTTVDGQHVGMVEEVRVGNTVRCTGVAAGVPVGAIGTVVGIHYPAYNSGRAPVDNPSADSSGTAGGAGGHDASCPVCAVAAAGATGGKGNPLGPLARPRWADATVEVLWHAAHGSKGAPCAFPGVTPASSRFASDDAGRVTAIRASALVKVVSSA